MKKLLLALFLLALPAVAYDYKDYIELPPTLPTVTNDHIITLEPYDAGRDIHLFVDNNDTYLKVGYDKFVRLSEVCKALPVVLQYYDHDGKELPLEKPKAGSDRLWWQLHPQLWCTPTGGKNLGKKSGN
jgi:hypothetical protein